MSNDDGLDLQWRELDWPGWRRASIVDDEFHGVNANFHDVVDQRQKWRQWKRRHEDRQEAKLTETSQGGGVDELKV